MSTDFALDSTFWAVNDESKYIETAIHSLGVTNLPISVSKICDQLTNIIVSSYDNRTSLFTYKSSWCLRITSVLSRLDVKYTKSKPNWENICMLINDRRLGIIHPSVQTFQTFPIIDDNTVTIKCSSLSNTSSSTSSGPKQPKLSCIDKEYIKQTFEDLNENFMWKLSTGVIVEQKMKEFALACNFEHPVHSLVLDLSDVSWKKYFTDQELVEMKSFNKKKLPQLPSDLNRFLIEARKFVDPTTLKNHLTKQFDCNGCEWAKDTILAYIKLFKYQQLPLNHQTEGDMLRRIWFFLDTVLDDSKINCIGGEKNSKSSCISKNLGRTLAAEDKMERKITGRKVDFLFTRQGLEYGCCECGRFDDETKQLYDGAFKMAKVLKDMLYGLYKAAPSSLRKFTLVGYLLYATKFTMVLCDSPAGYVTRITTLGTIDLPEDVEDISNKLLSMLQATYQARLLMEESNKLVRSEVIDLGKEETSDDLLLPCFSIEANKRKRRKSTDEDNQV